MLGENVRAALGGEISFLAWRFVDTHGFDWVGSEPLRACQEGAPCTWASVYGVVV